ncbi:MAG: bifunctional aspartate kinase/homoserine dehydrogenase I [Chitinophagaceae bacterium]|nr:bifunctional aspartate kinase/homoserine dehydrogenase I [Chitinophagaceae bacterium]
MQVLKFGGSSVANAENIRKVIAIVKKAAKNEKTVVVVSALGGITDKLIASATLAAQGDESYKEQLSRMEARHLEAVQQLIPIARQSGVLSAVKKQCNEIEDVCNGVFLLKELSVRTRDWLVSYGELLSSQIISAALQSDGVDNAWKDARALIRTDAGFGNARLDREVTIDQVQSYFNSSAHNLFVIPGFIASGPGNVTTTLGRGGSDYTAAILAAVMEASKLQIWTDVSGIMTADPGLVSSARVIPHISYQEAMELSHFGAKVIYPPTIQPVLKKGIPVWVKNTFAPDHEGTLIDDQAVKNGHAIRGISSIGNIALLSLEGGGMVGIPGFSKRLFEALAADKINVILITQGSSEHSICVGVSQADATGAKESVDRAFAQEIFAGQLEPLKVEASLAVIALVGDNMKNRPGISGKMFGALGRNGVNVRAIAQGSSERNISAVIYMTDVKKAVNVLHEEFFETAFKQLNLFIVGVGNVGSRLLDQLRSQKQYLQEHLRLQVRVVALADSKKMLFNDKGVNLDDWKEDLKNGEEMNLESFIQQASSKNFRNSIFADITANAEVAACYPKLLSRNISIVACNKIACSSAYQYYEEIKNLSREHNTSLLFETNVGASLPVIGTLNDLLRSGDKINKIQAVLSGTLNFVFNNYEGKTSFAEVVRRAQEEGFTEPDPRLDLSGKDVMRKIMILAREAGEQIEMEDISNESFMPASCMVGDVANFYAEMAKEEEHFKKLFRKAADAGAKLKFVATYEHGKAAVGLQQIGPDHDFYHLYGKDNVVLFYTDRYNEQPMVIKGAGAGADVTASGVFADIIRASRT